MWFLCVIIVIAVLFFNIENYIFIVIVLSVNRPLIKSRARLHKLFRLVLKNESSNYKKKIQDWPITFLIQL